MKPSVHDTRRRLLVLALVQGAAADALFRQGPPGLGLLLWAALGVATVTAVAWSSGRTLSLRCGAWLAAAVGFAALIVVRDAEQLLALDFLAGIVCLVLAAWSAAAGDAPGKAPLTAYAVRAVATALQTVAGGLHWLRPDPSPPPSLSPSPSATPSPSSLGRTWLRIGIGALAAVPLLVVFGGLFALADPVFEKAWQRLFSFDFPGLIRRLVVVAVWGWIAAGFGHQLLLPLPLPASLENAPSAPRRSPRVEVLTALSLLAALFLAFVVVQVRYLFGDDTLVRETVDLTYAEYARRGFFELVAVAALLLPVLLLADWLLGNDLRRRALNALILVLLGLLGLIIVSAARRLDLYTTAYGWTQARLYAAAALVWITLVSGWLAVSVIPRQRHRFASGAVAAALVLLVGLHGLNPDAFIARRNLQRAAGGEEFDRHHALRLSADAVPVLVAFGASLQPSERIAWEKALVQRWAQRPSPPWQTWNLARHRARALLLDAP